VNRLLALVDQAATTADLVELETAISDRQGQLDSLKSQQQYLADQIDYSTITLDLQEKGTLPSNVPGDFWSGLATGWAALTAALSGFVVVVGVLIPFLIPLAVIAAIVVLIVVLARRGGKTPRTPAPRTPAPSSPPAPPAP
jgi:Flp pilus assembly protein TadB